MSYLPTIARHRASSPSAPLRLSVAFQGGGAKLVALLGAYAALYELRNQGRIHITAVSGTSAGAIAATILAAAIPPDSAIDVLGRFQVSATVPDNIASRLHPPNIDIDFSAWNLSTPALVSKYIWNLRSSRHRKALSELRNSIAELGRYFETIKPYALENKPLIDQEPIRKLLLEILEHAPGHPRTFRELQTPTYVIASDLANSSTITYGPGTTPDHDIVDALLASTAIPFIFRRGDASVNPYMDGGFVANLPVQPLFHHHKPDDDFDECLAVSLLNTPSRMPPKGVLSLLKSMIDTSIEAGVVSARQYPGVSVLDLDPMDITTLDFAKAQDILRMKGHCYQNAMDATRDRVTGLISLPPKQVRQAYERYDTLMKEHQGQQVAPHHPGGPRYQKSCRSIWVKYTDFPEVMSMQNDLLRHLREILPDNWILQESDTADISKGGSTDGRFDAILRPEIAIAEEAFYLFPFFLSYLRKISWGVIPYGKQVGIGVLLHEDNPCYQWLTQVANYPTDDIPHSFHDLSPTDASWLTCLVQEIHGSTPKGRMWALKGYLFHEILPLMIRSKRNDLVQQMYSQIACIVDPRTGAERCDDDPAAAERKAANAEAAEVQERKLLSGQELITPNAFKLDSGMKRDVMIIDLAHVPEVTSKIDAKQLDAGFQVVPILHDLNIDVGIGFSLLAAPLVMGEARNGDGPVWKVLRDCAVNHLSD